MRVIVVAVLGLVSAIGTPASGQSGGGPADPRWASVREVFGRDGEAAEGYFRVNLPRTDLRVRIGDVVLESPFDLTTYFAFIPRHDSTVVGMGEVVLVQNEVGAAVAEARRQGVRVTALHNHLLGETPRLLFLHVMAEGPVDSVASKLRSIAMQTAVPVQRAAENQEDGEGPPPDWSAIDAVLGTHSEAEGGTAEYVFRRREDHTLHGGVRVRSSGVLETASEVVFQQIGNGQVANTGELYVLPGEVEGVVGTLEARGLSVTALHNHMIDESPPMYWVHWYATGKGPTLARGIAAALSQMNSEQRTGQGWDEEARPGHSMSSSAGHARMVHERGASVMPFALEETMHIFEMTDSGGIQDVIAKDPADTEQIRLIRQHLMHEAELFRNGDFSDPMFLHGRDMPGIAALSAAAGGVQVDYDTLPNGARLTFTTRDLGLVTAIHRWFGAQLSDHGADATYR